MPRYSVGQKALRLFLASFDIVMKIFRLVEPVLSGFAICLILWLTSTYFTAYIPFTKTNIWAWPNIFTTSHFPFFFFFFALLFLKMFLFFLGLGLFSLVSSQTTLSKLWFLNFFRFFFSLIFFGTIFWP
jgi:hypothetical protein